MNMELSTTEVAELTGASFRQIDYWARLGIITPSLHVGGSGNRRRWSASVVPVVRCMAQVQAAVTGTPTTGQRGALDHHTLRRIAANHDRGSIELQPGIVLSWALDEVAA